MSMKLALAFSCYSLSRLVHPGTSLPTPNRLDTPAISLPSYPASMFLSWVPMIPSWSPLWFFLFSFNNPLCLIALEIRATDPSDWVATSLPQA